jgi:DNA modification methylase
MATLHHGDCLEILRAMPDASVDAVVTDPPYGLSFMGKKWDYDVPSEDIWRECLRVLKPGGHLLAFAGTRTQHRMAVRIEDAGFEIRDMIAWVYGSGFPKSLDVSKAIDKAEGAQREVVGPNKFSALNGKANLNTYGTATRPDETAPATASARQWQGWGTALKPALEPITLARKPLEGTVAANVLAHGTGGLNVDGCRVASSDQIAAVTGKATLCGTRDGYDRPWKHDPAALAARQERANAAIEKANTLGRWPANLIHDGSDEVVGLFPERDGSKPGTRYNGPKFDGDVYNASSTAQKEFGYGDSGSAARFFYCAKASKADRDEGCEALEERKSGMSNGAQLNGEGYDKGQDIGLNRVISRRNNHPTVKPTALMRYLCRLVTPPGGVVLDPFMGSGSTGKAAILEGFQFVGIEREEEYIKIAKARIDSAFVQQDLFAA